MRREWPLRLLALLFASGAISSCGGDAWLRESNPSGNLFFDPRLATESRAFWYVSASQISVAAAALETRTFVAISPERATPLIGQVPDVPPGDSLYLIRAIDVDGPRHLRVYQVGAWVQVHAGTRSSCFPFAPPIRRQPIVVALPRAPTRLRLTYSCAE